MSKLEQLGQQHFTLSTFRFTEIGFKAFSETIHYDNFEDISTIMTTCFLTTTQTTMPVQNTKNRRGKIYVCYNHDEPISSSCQANYIYNI